MNKLKSIFVSLVALSVGASATAQVWEVKDWVSTCDPRPYITLKLTHGADTLMLGSGTDAVKATALNIRTASKLEYSVGGGEPVSVPFFTNLDKQDSTLTYFLHDLFYLPAGAQLKVSVPALSVHTSTEALKQSAETRAFTVNDVYEVTRSVRSSAIASAANGKSIIVKHPNVLTVDGELECKQLVVEAGGDDHLFGAGVVINEGASLSVSDTAYFLCNAISNRVSGYLINRGEYSAAASVFEKNASNSYDLPYAETYGYDKTKMYSYYSTKRPYFSIPVVDPDPVFSLGCNGRFYILLIFSKYKVSTTGKNLYYGLTMGNKFAYEYPNELMQLCPLDDTAAVFRAKGTIFDGESVEKEVSFLNLSAYGPDTTHYFSQSVINNDYQAAIDWISVVGDDEEKKRLLRAMDIRYDQAARNWSECNFMTGLTTYDGPMRYGFVQPAMEPAFFPQLDSVSDGKTITIGKKDLVSYADVPSDEMTTTLPFVRFYVNDVNPVTRKSVGTRSVFVAYFLPEEKLDSLQEQCADEIHFKYDFNSVWENAETYGLSDVGNAIGAVFPFVGGKTRGAGPNTFMSIKGYAIPQEEYSISMQDEVKIYADPKQEKVEFGILDYGNLGNLSVTCAGLSVNVKGKEDVTRTVLDITQNGDYGSNVNNSSRYRNQNAKLVSLKFDSYMQKREPSTSVPSVSSDDVFIIKGVQGGIEILGSGDCSVRVFDLAGVCVADKSAQDGVIIGSLARGGYVVEVSGADFHKTELVRVF